MPRSDIEERVRFLERELRLATEIVRRERDMLGWAAQDVLMLASQRRAGVQFVRRRCSLALRIKVGGCGGLLVPGATVRVYTVSDDELQFEGTSASSTGGTAVFGEARATNLPVEMLRIEAEHPRFAGPATLEYDFQCAINEQVTIDLAAVGVASGYHCIANTCGLPWADTLAYTTNVGVGATLIYGAGPEPNTWTGDQGAIHLYVDDATFAPKVWVISSGAGGCDLDVIGCLPPLGATGSVLGTTCTLNE